MKPEEYLPPLLKISSVILIVSALIDLWLWYKRRFKVPSWVVSALSIAFAMLSIVFAICIGERSEKKRKRGKTVRRN